MADAANGNELTIDQLAQRTGMTARNIRAHQSRGLVPPPEVRGRTGYYGSEHIARIRLIQELQADGFNLELIRRLLVSAAGSSGDVLNFTRVLRTPFVDEQPEILDAAELAEQWQSTDIGLLTKAESLGLLRALGDGRYEVASPRLAKAGQELAALGVPVEKALELAARLRRRADDVAEIYTRLFLETIWKPFEEAGQPDDRWPEIQAAVERLRPLASDALLAAFQLAMDDAIESAFGRVMSRMERKRR